MKRGELAEELLCAVIRRVVHRRKKKPKMRWTLRVGGVVVKFTGAFIMQVSDIAGKFVPFTLPIVDAAGNPAPVDGTPEISIDRTDLVTLKSLALDPADGLWKGEFEFVGPLGAANLHVKADADLGEGTVTIEGDGVLERTASQATGVGFGFGMPHD